MQEDLTWLKELLSEVIETSGTAKSKNLAVPVCVTTRWEAVDLRWTETGNALATYLPMHVLTLAQTEAVRLTIAL